MRRPLRALGCTSIVTLALAAVLSPRLDRASGSATLDLGEPALAGGCLFNCTPDRKCEPGCPPIGSCTPWNCTPDRICEPQCRPKHQTISGRCVYRDSDGSTKPVPGAAVEIRHQEFGLSTDADVVGPFSLELSGNDICATAASDADGRFSFSDVCRGGAVWSKLYARCSLEGPQGRVIRSQFPFNLYSAATVPQGGMPSAFDLGEIALDGAAATGFLKLADVFHRESSTVSPLLAVWEVFPGGQDVIVANTNDHYFASYTLGVFMSMGAGQQNTGTAAHEFGHSLQFQSFLDGAPDPASFGRVLTALDQFANHLQSSGHAFDSRTNPVFAYAEGWAEYNEGSVYGSGIPDCSAWPELGMTEDERISVEGNIACRLTRLRQRWGAADIWNAQVRAKSAEYPNFFAEFARTHPGAAAVALPSLPANNTPRPAPHVLQPGGTGFVYHTVPVPALAHLSGTPTEKALFQAQGSHCKAVAESHQNQVRLLEAACPKEADPKAKDACEAKLKDLRAHATAVGAVCAK